MAEQPPSLSIKGFLPKGAPVKGDGEYKPIGTSVDGAKFRLMIDAKISNFSDLVSLFTDLLAAYLKLAGRVNGQTAYGGTATGEFLTLYGNVVDGDTGVVRIGNLRLLGTRVPATAGDLSFIGGVFKAYDSLTVTRLMLSTDAAPTINTVPYWNGNSWSSSTVQAASGGTGRSTLTTGALLIGNTTAAVQMVGPGSTGQIAISNGTTFAMQTLGTDATLASDGTLTIASGVITYAKLQSASVGFVILAKPTTGSGSFSELAVGTNTILGRVAGNIVAAQLVGAQVTTNTLTYSLLQQSSTGFVILAKATTGAGNYAELAMGTDTVLRRSGSGDITGGKLVAGHFDASTDVPLTALADQATVTINANATSGSAPPTAVAITSGHGLFNAGTTLTSRYFSQYAAITGTSNTPTAAQNGTLFNMDSSSGAVTATLPSAATVGSGYTVGFYRSSVSNVCTINTTSSQTINAYTSTTLIQLHARIIVQSNGANWIVLGVNDYLTASVAQGSAVSATGSGQYTDITSITIPTGEWDVTGTVDFSANGAVLTSGKRVGISVTSGNSATGLAFGDNVFESAPQTATYNEAGTVPAYRVLLTTATAHYLKFFNNYTGGPPKGCGRIAARRVA